MWKFILLVLAGICLVKGIPLPGAESRSPYNSTYPISQPVINGSTIKYRIAIITDKDILSKVKDDLKWICKIKRGWVEVSGKGEGLKVIGIEMDKTEDTISYDLNKKGRAMEMSELKVFNGKLYTCDDRTGIVYELVEGSSSPIPFYLLNDGDGAEPKGFKCEWMTVKDDLLYVGSVGMEWLNRDGTIQHNNTFWVKTLNHKGQMKSYNWYDRYDAIRKSVHYEFPGYFFNEAVNWSEEKQKWFFLPRKGSNVIYDSKEDERRCTNMLFSTDENFTNVQMVEVGQLNKTRGFSSFKFIPGSKDEAFLALKTVEVDDTVETYIGGYNVRGEEIYGLKFICNDKYEGLEFV